MKMYKALQLTESNRVSTGNHCGIYQSISVTKNPKR